ncbi:bifunctional adenosylcobinamide kinase/adenosylcobinamide-phosphate guanylyltransferase [Gorillibacterium massiliense]|uniref:bifunctional adenosylcobinamide kinase/adenosylcobinamide-phosphate guanylyltransferase n=1 Tax=Gorillibacterium massiliense TaxID=1280390 RepID=UPI0004ACDCAA|nr:bifunctional adenosylcobinamide kinase/adenosylcobinamide-phosphate guanylyltransferase [Gorillibacterium massiliense]
MRVFIIGGVGNGKSVYAEKVVSALAAGQDNLYYVATMQIYDEESRRKVDRHLDVRAGKGFETIEQPANVAETLAHMKDGATTVLLECMTNLVANEMFSEAEMKPPLDVAAKIFEDICFLSERVDHLVIVSNNVFEDGIPYENGTRSYIEALGKVHEQIASWADVVTEVVVGIPVPIKGELYKLNKRNG